MTSPRPVLILDDDAELREVLAELLDGDGAFAAATAGSVAQAEAMLSARDARFDALILGVVLLDGDGCDLCARLRRDGHGMPILMLAGSDVEADVVRGLEAGANDYIAKPVRPGELLARLRAQLRGFESSAHAVFTIGPYTFRPAAKLLHDPARNRHIHLTDKETGVLRLLLRAGGKAVNQRRLLGEVWGYNAAMTTHTLETHIYRLRRKIEPDPGNARLVVTTDDGYRLDAAPPSAAAV